MTRETDRAYLKRPVGDTAGLPSTRTLAVLIVSQRAHEPLEVCLDSVAEHLPELPIHVYDHGGTEHAELAAKHPAVQWFPGQPNAGFAAACNAVVEQMPADVDLLLLDPHARVLGPLNRTRELLRQPRVAAVSPLARDAAAPGRAPWDVAARHHTVTRELSAAAGRSAPLRRTPPARRYSRQPPESRSIDGDLAPICLAISRAAWNTIGGFDEEYFGYGEAADWQARARAAGWRILLADELGVERRDPTTDDGPRRRRDRDLVRTNTALLLEHQRGVHHADVYLAGTAALRRLRRPQRARRRTDLPSIVIATNRLVYGGAERQKALLATELDRRGYPVTIVCVQRFGPLIAEIPNTVRVVRQPWWAPMVDIAEGPAVLITGDTNTEVGFGTLWRAAGRRRRWLVAPHVPPEEHRPIYSRPLTAAMRRADGFIVLAQRHWDMLAKQHRLWGRRFVAPNGVTDSGEPSRRHRSAGEPLHLVMLSRIVEHKNPHLLIEALGGLVEVPWKLSIFGDGPDRERLQEQTPAGLRDRVQWRGWSAGPGPALADADLLCVPSRSEAFPVVILEAMARAVPVAASAICAVPEMLDFGEAGFLVEPVSVSGWREHLTRIMADPDALPSVGQRGYERMRKHYTVEAMADAYLSAIGAVL
ncbi:MULTISPECIES: glycosyltransferase [Mycobacterium]|uniref:glycosyltransferase n=1 Tax=Mycobacterium TaxID=1763 RepID=UPI001CDA4CBC|nr:MULTISPECIES: glycosyltransferase [Mycobacterium]MCA2243968.1 glycosyltransferase [Mycobacterium sp. WUMAC-067]MCA2314808.1 glycosyltransferase [Mycobacterium sp. WUMAC-025]MEE3753719.1 glycosyltransferase [Mycobacterium intracellulare]